MHASGRAVKRSGRAVPPASTVALAAIGSLMAGAAFYGARFYPAQRGARTWYRRLEEPPFNPPDSVFPPVWTALYIRRSTS